MRRQQALMFIGGCGGTIKYLLQNSPIFIGGFNIRYYGPLIYAASPLEYSKDTGTPLSDINVGAIKFLEVFDPDTQG